MSKVSMFRANSTVVADKLAEGLLCTFRLLDDLGCSRQQSSSPALLDAYDRPVSRLSWAVPSQAPVNRLATFDGIARQAYVRVCEEPRRR